VLFGEMSLIGPRPLLPEDQPSNRFVRLSVRPGISGWAQVNGGKLVTKEQKEKLDEMYVHNVSLWLDLQIVVLTLKMVLKGHSSSEESLADREQVQDKNIKFQDSIRGTGRPMADPDVAGLDLNMELNLEYRGGANGTRAQA
jgi:hypothetical protein